MVVLTHLCVCDDVAVCECWLGISVLMSCGVVFVGVGVGVMLVYE